MEPPPCCETSILQLPDSLLIEILGYVDFFPVLLGLRVVCKRFKAAIDLNVDVIGEYVHISSALCGPFLQGEQLERAYAAFRTAARSAVALDVDACTPAALFLQHVLERSGPWEKLQSFSGALAGTEAARALAERVGPALTELRVRALDEREEGAAGSLTDVSELLEGAGRLTALSLAGCTWRPESLAGLLARSCPGIELLELSLPSALALPPLLPCAPRLRRVALQSAAGEGVALSGEAVAALLALPALAELELLGVQEDAETSWPALSASPGPAGPRPPLPPLTSLSLEIDCDPVLEIGGAEGQGIGEAWVVGLLRGVGGRLQTLKLSYGDLTDAAAHAIARHCPALRELELSSAYLLSDSGAAELCRRCSALRSLSFVEVALVGGETLRAAARHGKHLEYFGIAREADEDEGELAERECEWDPGAVAALRRRGCVVDLYPSPNEEGEGPAGRQPSSLADACERRGGEDAASAFSIAFSHVPSLAPSALSTPSLAPSSLPSSSCPGPVHLGALARIAQGPVQNPTGTGGPFSSSVLQ
eukprot:tig00000383_g24667.t1